MTGRSRFQLYLLLLIAFTVILTVLSLQSFPVRPPAFSNQDKVGHFFAYAFIAWLACQALGSRLRYPSTLVFSFIYASLTGAVLELLQAYLTTSRQGEWADLVANLLGAFTGCVIFSLRQRIKCRNECNETDSAA